MLMNTNIVTASVLHGCDESKAESTEEKEDQENPL